MVGLKDRVVVVTGAAGAIPSAAARIFAERGAQLVLTDLAEEKAQSVADDLPRTDSAVVVRQNVADPEDAAHLAETCRSRYGRVDAVVIGAGLYERLPLAQLTPEQWREALAVNLDGALYTILALRPLLAPDSAIVTIASHAGHQGSLDHTPYAAAKGGLLALTRSLAKELAPKTRVNSVSPGLIDTKMLKAMEEERRRTMTAATPLRRLGRAEEIAEAIVFLCSPEASFITGATLHANGGLYMAS